MEKVNTVIDFDVLRKEEVSFILRGVKYEIPSATYGMHLELLSLDKQIDKALKDEDPVAMSEATIKGVLLAVPTMTKEILLNDVSVDEIRGIQRLVNESLKGEEEVVDPEIEFYRKKYEDEYRKNLSSTKERKSRKKK